MLRRRTAPRKRPSPHSRRTHIRRGFCRRPPHPMRNPFPSGTIRLIPASPPGSTTRSLCGRIPLNPHKYLIPYLSPGTRPLRRTAPFHLRGTSRSGPFQTHLHWEQRTRWNVRVPEDPIIRPSRHSASTAVTGYSPACSSAPCAARNCASDFPPRQSGTARMDAYSAAFLSDSEKFSVCIQPGRSAARTTGESRKHHSYGQVRSVLTSSPQRHIVL